MNRSATIKVGVMAVVSLALLVAVMIWLRGRGLTPGETYDVLFRDVDGMREGAPVQIMGIRVGFVDLIEPVVLNDKYFVRVTFSVTDESIKVPSGSMLSIQQSGLIGEKFLEISPPPLRDVTLTTFAKPENAITAGIPVKFVYEDGVLTVGKVERVDRFDDENLTRYKFYYRVTRPGAIMPDKPVFELKMTRKGKYYLLIVPQEPVLTKAPDKELFFTIENPLRMKEFLEVQMASAEALKVTNEKITQLLSDETIATLSSTVKNTEILTARATDVLDSANELIQLANDDLETLVTTSEKLADNLVVMSDNINEVIGDPALKADIKSTVASIEHSANALNGILNDPALQETFALAHDTTRDASELVELLRETAEDRELQQRLERSLALLNGSLEKLSRVLDNVDALTADEDTDIQAILDETRETTGNLRTFSEKLNKRFLLFRLMF